MEVRISFDEIRHVRVGATETAIILGKDVFNVPTEVIIKTSDIPAVALPLLCCACAAAADPSTGKKPLPGFFPADAAHKCGIALAKEGYEAGLEENPMPN